MKNKVKYYTVYWEIKEPQKKLNRGKGIGKVKDGNLLENSLFHEETLMEKVAFGQI